MLKDCLRLSFESNKVFVDGHYRGRNKRKLVPAMHNLAAICLGVLCIGITSAYVSAQQLMASISGESARAINFVAKVNILNN